MFFVAKICKRALRASIEGYLAVAASTPTYSSLIKACMAHQGFTVIQDWVSQKCDKETYESRTCHVYKMIVTPFVSNKYAFYGLLRHLFIRDLFRTTSSLPKCYILSSLTPTKKAIARIGIKYIGPHTILY